MRAHLLKIYMHKRPYMMAAGVAGFLAFTAQTQAQSSDALLDKLVEKGILTVKEASELREETDQGFSQALQTRMGMPEWVTAYKLGGDFRARYEGFYSGNATSADRNRFQYRLRYGVTANVLENMEVGFRLASIGDTGSNQISSNNTFDNNASKKGIAIDMAYGKWTPIDNGTWVTKFTVGKMENPLEINPTFVDQDYTPEGFGQQITYRVHENHDLQFNAGQFVLDESGTSADAYMLGAQLKWDARWSQKLQSSAGIMALIIPGREVLAEAGSGLLDIGEGNTRVPAGGPPLYNFDPIIADASVTYTFDKAPFYNGAFPVRLAGSYLNNPSAPQDNEGYSVKLTLGKAGKRKTWELSYELRELQADAIYEELPESDFNAYTQAAGAFGNRTGYVNGTNVRGHIIKAGYSPYDSFAIFVTLWMTENIHESPAGSDSNAQRLQVDAIWKF